MQFIAENQQHYHQTNDSLNLWESTSLSAAHYYKTYTTKACIELHSLKASENPDALV